jgi:hypothetical protein
VATKVETAYSLGKAAASLAAVIVASLIFASSVLAVGPPHMSPGEIEVKSSEFTQTSAGPFFNEIEPNGLETKWEYDYAPAEENGQAPARTSGTWKPVPGGSGTTPAISVSQYPIETEKLTGLTAETAYYVRLKASNADGELVLESGVVSPLITPFETVPLRPRSFCCQIISVGGTSMHLRGQVIPDNFETTWRFEYATGESGPWTPAPGGGTITEADEAFHQVEGELTGLSPETSYYVRLVAENEHGEALVDASNVKRIETGGKPSAGTFAVHSIQGDALRGLGYVFPHGFDTHFHVEYVTQERFDESDWTAAESAPPVDAGPGEYSENIGFPTLLVGENLPNLQAGVTYRYRLVASSAQGTVQGTEQTLTVPVPAPAGEPSCSNQQFRTGPSARLPDCRAYEQVTPADKGGAMDIDTYGGVQDEAHIGEAGDHFMLSAAGVQWGPSPDSKDSTYFFSRSAEGWQMGSVTPQPEAGANSYGPSVSPLILSRDLTQTALEVGWRTTKVSESPDAEFKAGPSGGPYVTAAVVHRAQPSRWVAGGGGGGGGVGAGGRRRQARPAVRRPPVARTSG